MTAREELIAILHDDFQLSYPKTYDICDFILEDRKHLLHEMRMLIQSLPIKKTDYRYRICDRNQGIGWNECRLEMFKKIGTLDNATLRG